MPGQYSTHCGRRPCAGRREPVEAPARLFVCVGCQVQVLICRCCDRGQIYCASGCAQEARHHAQREVLVVALAEQGEADGDGEDDRGPAIRPASMAMIQLPVLPASLPASW